MKNEKYKIEKLFLSINKIFDNIGFDEYFLKEFYKKNIKDLINLFQNNIETNIDIFTIYCYELLINISKESKYDNFLTTIYLLLLKKNYYIKKLQKLFLKI